MNRLLPPICLLVMAAGSVLAQEQEDRMRAWVDSNWKQVLQATNGNGKAGSVGRSAFNDKTFGGGSFTTKNFGSGAYLGTKSASLKSFDTRSFFGIKNPWFGKKIFDTYASSATERSAGDASKKYESGAFGVREYAKTGQDLTDANVVLPNSAQPRPYIAPAKAPGVMDRYTENLHKDLSIDDVRELLNKGHTQ